MIYEQASEVRELGVGINALPHCIAELAELGLLPALDAVALRTSELIYLNRLGQEVWREPRGLDAGHEHPQFSIHRGRLQKVLYDAVIERLGRACIRTGRRLAGFVQDEGGVTAHFVDARDGLGSETVRGEILIAADGIHSAARRYFYPREGGAELARRDAVARRDRRAGVPHRPLDDHRRRHGREARALSDRRRRARRYAADQLGDRDPRRRWRRSRRRRARAGRGWAAPTSHRVTATHGHPNAVTVVR